MDPHLGPSRARARTTTISGSGILTLKWAETLLLVPTCLRRISRTKTSLRMSGLFFSFPRLVCIGHNAHDPIVLHRKLTTC